MGNILEDIFNPIIKVVSSPVLYFSNGTRTTQNDFDYLSTEGRNKYFDGLTGVPYSNTNTSGGYRHDCSGLTCKVLKDVHGKNFGGASTMALIKSPLLTVASTSYDFKPQAGYITFTTVGKKTKYNKAMGTRNPGLPNHVVYHLNDKVYYINGFPFYDVLEASGGSPSHYALVSFAPGAYLTEEQKRLIQKVGKVPKIYNDDAHKYLKTMRLR